MSSTRLAVPERLSLQGKGEVDGGDLARAGTLARIERQAQMAMLAAAVQGSTAKYSARKPFATPS